MEPSCARDTAGATLAAGTRGALCPLHSNSKPREEDYKGLAEDYKAHQRSCSTRLHTETL